MKGFRVIDNIYGGEADSYEIVVNEEWAKDLMYCDMEGFAVLESGALILADECERFEYCPKERFTIEWETDENA